MKENAQGRQTLFVLVKDVFFWEQTRFSIVLVATAWMLFSSLVLIG